MVVGPGALSSLLGLWPSPFGSWVGEAHAGRASSLHTVAPGEAEPKLDGTRAVSEV